MGIKFYPIPCGKFDRRFLPNTIFGVPKTIIGLFRSYIILKKIKPNIVISFGGYVSVPVVINCWLQQILSITHEQTLTNSLTTRINSLFVNKIALSFNNQKQIDQLPKNKTVITGNLLRFELFKKTNITNPNFRFPNQQQPLIYITAGNQGSHTINMLIKKILPFLTNYNIIHQTGNNDLSFFKPLIKKYSNYIPSDYFSTPDYGWIIQHADIFISRAGANTCQEIVNFNKKSILIPLLKSQQNEQDLNALWVKDCLPQKTIIYKQSDLNQKDILDSILSLTKHKENQISKKNLPNLKLLNLINEII